MSKGIVYKGDGEDLCSFCDKKCKGHAIIKEGFLSYCMQEHIPDKLYPHLEPNIKPRGDYMIVESNVNLKLLIGKD